MIIEADLLLLLLYDIIDSVGGLIGKLIIMNSLMLRIQSYDLFSNLYI